MDEYFKWLNTIVEKMRFYINENSLKSIVILVLISGRTFTILSFIFLFIINLFFSYQ